MTSVCDLISKEFKIACLNMHKFVIVDLFCLNPCWSFDNNLLHKGVIILFTNFENNLGIIDNLDIGR